MKKTTLIFGILVLALSSACQQFKTGEGGLQYKIVNDEGKAKAVAGDLLAINVVVSSDRDSVLSSTYEIGLPQIVNIAPDSIPGLYPGDYNTMFKMLGEGDSAVFKLDLDTMAARINQPKPEFSDKYVVFTVKVLKHFPKGELADEVLHGHVNDYFEAEIEKLKDAEEAKITQYVSKNKLETQTTSTGLQYVITEAGDGPVPAVGDSVRVNYQGRLTTGYIFDTNIKEVAEKQDGLFNPMRQYEPIQFPVGVGQVVPGWDEGLQLLPKGTKATLIIPSALAYGDRGEMRAKIPPFAPLVFDVEIVDIIKPTAAPETETPNN